MSLRAIAPWAALVIAALFLVARPDPAAALSCTATIDDVAFGPIDTLSAPTTDVTANVTATCTGGALGLPVRVCPSIGTGSGGTTYNPRTMSGPAPLAYQLYTDPAHTIVWGSLSGGIGVVPPLVVPISGTTGNGSASLTLYARLPASSNPAAAGSYVSNFTITDTSFGYDLASVLTGCLLGALQQATPTFTVSASIGKNCSINTDNMSFGSQGLLSAPLTATGRVGVLCTPATTSTLALSNGGTGSGPAARKMVKGSESITYGLYQDSALSQPWGDTTGVGATVMSLTGTGSQQNLPVYGQVPAQATPSPGFYTDTVVVTLTY